MALPNVMADADQKLYAVEDLFGPALICPEQSQKQVERILTKTVFFVKFELRNVFEKRNYNRLKDGFRAPLACQVDRLVAVGSLGNW